MYWKNLILGNKRTDLEVGSFVWVLMVPTGFEPAECNWLIEWFSMRGVIVLCR